MTVDTLRADRLGVYGSALGLTPRLDALARESLVFEAAYASTAFTLPSIGALLTGRHPESCGLHSNESTLPEGVPTLAGLLRGAGWRTAAVVGNYVLRRQSGLAAGFDFYDDELGSWEQTRGWPERRAGALTDAALPILEECTALRGERCFLWVHYQDPHGPYTPPAGWRERYLEVERAAPRGAERLPLRLDQMGLGGIPRYQALEGRRDVAFYRAGYDAEVAYVDREIGRLLDAVGRLALEPDALVVFAADHGEALGEDDYWFAHGEYLSEPLVRVPLLLRAPGLAPGRRADVVALLDVFPTLARRLAPGRAPAGLPGRDLLAPGAAAAASAPYLATLAGATARRFAIVEGEYKLLATPREDGFETRLVRRSREGEDLGGALPERAARLLARLGALRAELAEGPPEIRQRLSPEDRARLRALGYTR